MKGCIRTTGSFAVAVFCTIALAISSPARISLAGPREDIGALEAKFNAHLKKGEYPQAEKILLQMIEFAERHFQADPLFRSVAYSDASGFYQVSTSLKKQSSMARRL